VSIAFLYNAYAGPMRVAFKRSPIYNTTSRTAAIIYLESLLPPCPDDNSTSLFNDSSLYDNSTATTMTFTTEALPDTTFSLSSVNDSNNDNSTNSVGVGAQCANPPLIIGYFPGYETPDNRVYWWIADYLCDLIYLLDILMVKSRIEFIKNGMQEVSLLTFIYY